MKDIREIRSGDIEDFYLSLPKDLALKTQKNIMDTLHKLFNDARRRKDIDKVPDFPMIRPDEPKTGWIDEETQDKIYALIPDQHKPIFLFLLREGCRPGEVRALQVEDIDYENKTVIIQRTFSKGILRKKTKGKTIRILPLDDEVYTMLKKIRKIQGFVFTDEQEDYYHKNKLNRIWNKALRELGLPTISLYEGTRHSFASQAVNRKVPLNLIGDFLGHSNYEITKRYAKINVNGLKNVLRSKAKIKKFKSPKTENPS